MKEFIKHGILGTRADLMMDIVIISLVVIVPAILVSIRNVKRSDFASHKKIQTSLLILLTIAVTLFEIDSQSAGGIFVLSKGSGLYQTAILNFSIYIHLFFSISTAFIWIFLVIFSLKYFPSPPIPNHFSKIHKFWGKLGMIDMIFTAITGIELYIMIFVM